MVEVIENKMKVNKENFIAWVIKNKEKINNWLADNPDGLPERMLKSNNIAKMVISVILYSEEMEFTSGEGKTLMDECLEIQMDELLA